MVKETGDGEKQKWEKKKDEDLSSKEIEVTGLWSNVLLKLGG